LERLTKSGVDVLVVVGSEESRGLYRGDHRRIRALIGKGRLCIETVPNLEHSLLERTGRDRVSELLSDYVARRVADMTGPAHLDEVP